MAENRELRELFPTASDIPPEWRVLPDENPPVYLIDGRVERFAGESRPVHSKIALREGDALKPILLGYEAQLTAAEGQAAVEAAERAWGGGLGAWPRASFDERMAAVEVFATSLAAQTERVATLLMFEIGKSHPDATKEVVRSIAYIRDTVTELRELVRSGREIFTGKKGSAIHHACEVREPLGIVLCVAPFNYPVNEFLTTIIPALLMGNVVVAKTPRFGALANQVMAQTFADSFPPGVVALLPGDGRQVIPPIMGGSTGDPAGQGKGAIDMLAFIGSEGAANAIIHSHPSPVTLHKVLGLGAKNAAVILPGADLEEVAKALAPGALGFNGQRCTAEKIIFVPRAQGEDFAARLARHVSQRKVGMPWTDGAAITPLPEDGKVAAMRAYIDDAIEHGARVVNQGGGEYFHSLIRPAVLYPVSPEARIYREEQFGPVVPIVPYDDVEEVYAWQRAMPFGQQAGIWGAAAELAPTVAAFTPLVSRVNINDVCQRGPDSFGFTATDKSGFGVLSLRDALITFSRPVLVQSVDPDALVAGTGGHAVSKK